MFKLNFEDIKEYKRKRVDWGPIGQVVYERTYSRTKADGTKERWFDTCVRVVEGVYTIQKDHCLRNSIRWNGAKAQKSALEMFKRMFDFKWLPPGRGIWSMGTDTVALKGGAVLNNCGFVNTNGKEDKTEAPLWLMDMSMLGVGVGFGAFSDSGQVDNIVIHKAPLSLKTHVVEDSREGWLKAIEVVLNTMFHGEALPQTFDFSMVRPLGALLKGMGGVASGPGPLRQLILDLLDIAGEYIAVECPDRLEILLYKPLERKCSSADIVDLNTVIAKCVVSGGIRRSATIALGNPDDDTFLTLKQDGPKMASNRWASNNSVVIRAGQDIDYNKIASHIAKNGEPGIFWLDNARWYSRMNGVPDFKDLLAVGTNPCSEQTLFDYELCCLVEMFLARHKTLEDFLVTIKFAYLYAKTVTLVPTHNEKTNKIIAQNRRIGTSVTGVAQFLETRTKDDLIHWLSKGYAQVQYYDTIYSDWFKVNRSIKTTSVKPSGTVSLLPGSTPGIHYPHSVYSIRRVRVEDTSPLVDSLKRAGYYVEKAVNEPNTSVVEFPIYEKCSRSKKDISMREQFELAALLQEHWADNQVSVTIHFQEHEVNDIGPMLKEFSTKLKGVSLLPLKADTEYVQAPYQAIDEDTYFSRKAMINESEVLGWEQTEVDKFCDSDSCKVF